MNTTYIPVHPGQVIPEGSLLFRRDKWVPSDDVGLVYSSDYCHPHIAPAGVPQSPCEDCGGSGGVQMGTGEPGSTWSAACPSCNAPAQEDQYKVEPFQVRINEVDVATVLIPLRFDGGQWVLTEEAHWLIDKTKREAKPFDERAALAVIDKIAHEASLTELCISPFILALCKQARAALSAPSL